MNHLGMKNRKIAEMITATRLNKLSLSKNAISTVCTTLKEKIQIKNAASVYQFVNLFNLFCLQNSTLSYLERCFSIISDNESFLELEYNFISKILASSGLLINSEIELFKIADRWLNHNIEERSKYAKNLLFKVCLPLLSTETKRSLLNDSTFFKKDHSCVKILNKMLDCKEKKLYKSSSSYRTSRSCKQKCFNLLVLGGNKLKTAMANSNVSCINVNKVRDVEAYPPMITGRFNAKVVYLKGDIYVFGGCNKDGYWINSVDKYSLIYKKWIQISEMHDKCPFFCASAFIDKIFVNGGKKDGVKTNSCLQFDTRDCVWKEVATMNEPRSSAACAVFEERIIVSGGLSNNENVLNSVESYDVLPDKWSTMSNMNSGKYNHSLVVVNNKLFVISNIKDSCEVFDNICRKFITIKSPQFKCFPSTRAYSIDKKIFVLQDISSNIISYDTDKNKWSEESCEVTKTLRWFSSVKVPCL